MGTVSVIMFSERCKRYGRTRLTIGTIPLTLVTGYYGHVQLATRCTHHKTVTETSGLELDSNLSSTFADISIHKADLYITS